MGERFDWSGLEGEDEPAAALSPIDAIFAETALRGLTSAFSERLIDFTAQATKTNRETIVAVLNQALSLSSEERAKDRDQHRSMILDGFGALARQMAAIPPPPAPLVEVRAAESPAPIVQMDTTAIAEALRVLAAEAARSNELLAGIAALLKTLTAPRSMTVRRDNDGRISGAEVR